MIALPIVSPKEALEGRVSSTVERIIRRLESGSPVHAGALRAAAALCGRGLRGGLPPSAAELPRRVLELVGRVAGNSRSASPSIASLERELLGGYEHAEGAVVRAFSSTLPKTLGPCPFPEQEAAWDRFNQAADRAFQRHVSLSAHLMLDTHSELLRALGAPSALIDVLVGLASAHASLMCAAGSLRHASFRAQAFQQANWDSQRPTSRLLGSSIDELAVQTLHEFIGAKFSSHVVREQAQLEEFFLWAMGGSV